jgi:hypothetical protein
MIENIAAYNASSATGIKQEARRCLHVFLVVHLTKVPKKLNIFYADILPYNV